MKYLRSNILPFFSLLLIFVVASLVVFNFGLDTVFAQQDQPTINSVAQDIDEDIALGGADLQVIVARIINVALGLLGIVALGFVLYAGYMWMTAGGNEEKVADAKKILVNATIGLVIILSSFAITRFIFDALGDATGVNDPQQVDDGNGGGGNLPDCDGLNCVPDLDDEDMCLEHNEFFVVKSISPNTAPEDEGNRDIGLKDAHVRVVFSGPVDEDVDINDIIIVSDSSGVVAPSDIELSHNRRVVTASFDENSGVCTVGNGGIVTCLPEEKFSIEVNENLQGEWGRLQEQNECGEFPREATFNIEQDANDDQAPQLSDVEIDGNNLNAHNGMTLLRGEEHTLTAVLSDRNNGQGGVSYLEVEIEETRRNGQQGRSYSYIEGPKVQDGTHEAYRLSHPFTPGVGSATPARYDVTLTGWDLDGNSVQQTNHFILVGEQCQNGQLDQGEIEIDVGGACPGVGACNANWECASNQCVDGQCVRAPIITNVSPKWEGASGNLITVQGKFFGAEQGIVEFGVQNEDGSGVANWIPAGQACDGADVWDDSWAIVSIPQGVNVGDQLAIRVRRADGEYEDTSINENGLKPGPHDGWFVINNNTWPGLCEVDPEHGEFGERVTIRGGGFGDDQGDGQVFFSQVSTNVTAWDQQIVEASVPNIQSGRAWVQVRKNQLSNAVSFDVQPIGEEENPEITSIDPGSTTKFSYVTVQGQRFGSPFGRVFLEDNPQEAVNCAQNPNDDCRELHVELLCSQTWSQNQVVFETRVKQGPQIERAGEYFVALRTADGRFTNEAVSLTITNGAPQPSICQLDPHTGPAPLPEGEVLTIYGKGFSDDPIVYFWTKGATAAVEDADNLLEDGDMEADGTGAWRAWNIEKHVKMDQDGNQVMGIDTSQEQHAGIQQVDVPGVEAGETYIFSFDYQLDSGVLRPRLGINNSNRDFEGQHDILRATNNEWETYRRKVIVPDDFNGDFRVVLSVENGIVYLDNIVLSEERGLETWLNSRDDGDDIIQDVNAAGTEIQTLIPQDPVTNYSMESGPIRVVSESGGISNGVQYTVQNCSAEIAAYARTHGGADHPLQEQGLRCCTTGPDQGQWLPEGQMCEGEERESGYVWRFSSGVIPERPRFIRQLACPVEDGIASPSPWERRVDGENVCLNASITGRFSMNIDADTLKEEFIRIYTCGRGADAECGEYQQFSYEEGIDVTDAFEFSVSQQDEQSNGFVFDRNQLQPNTWYRVTISDQIRAYQRVGNLLDAEGNKLYNTSTIQIESDVDDLPEGLAYYFDFKTGAADGGPNGDGLCQVVGARVTPPDYRASYLGVLQNPAYPFDPFALNRPAGALQHPLIYQVHGEADQQCIVLNVDDENWQWGPKITDFDAALARKKRSDDHQNDQATVRALRETEDEPVDITAEADIDGRDVFASSSLHIRLGSPRVTDWWPACSAACTNGLVGVRFNRAMDVRTYKNNNGVPNISIKECETARCESFTDTVIPLDIVVGEDPYLLQARIANQEAMSTSTWYLATVEDIVTVGGVTDIGKVIAGDTIETFSWKFRTKEEDAVCRVDRVEVHPNPFTATVIGEQTVYTSIPVSAPDACSIQGQRLDPWEYGWEWSSSDEAVATVTDFTSVGAPQAMCNISCLPVGSDVARDSYETLPAVCGDGKIDWDKGEDCDINANIYTDDREEYRREDGRTISETVGVSCSTSCLRPGNRETVTEENNVDVCGNGIVEPWVGEECDPGGDADNWENCSAICLRTGSLTEDEFDGQGFLCGDGEVTSEVEECEGGVGCSNRCLRTGSQYTNTTVCGNGVLETGEECEIVDQELLVIGGENGETRIPADGDLSALCTNQCLLRQVCEVQGIPQVAEGGVGCDPSQDEGCEPRHCRIVGSSAIYDTPSLCGDGITGSGEFPACEQDAGEFVLGQNPHQVVTAIGDSNESPLQSTIGATVTHVQTGDDAREAVNPEVTGIGEYTLQCGYNEQNVEFNPVNLVVDGDMEAAGNGGWSIAQPFPGSAGAIQKQDGLGIDESTALRVSQIQGGGNIIPVGAVYEMNDISINRYYRVRFSYGVVDTTGTVKIGWRKDGAFIGEVTEGDLVPADDWQTYSETVLLPPPPENDAVFTVGVFLDNVNPNGITVGQLYLDNVDVREVPALGQPTEISNDCPNNQDNTYGVGTNSCCLPRPARTESYPADASEDICRNTAIKVTFEGRRPIDESTLAQGALLAEGHADPNYECEGANLTGRVQGILADASYISEQQNMPWYQRLWHGVKNFFAQIFGGNVHAQLVQRAFYENIQTWCASDITLTPTVAYEEQEDSYLSTATFAISDALKSDTTYALVMRGGEFGIQDTTGVSIRGIQDEDTEIYGSDDMVGFKTGSTICKLRSVTVDPAKQLFNVPQSTSTFVARTQSTGGPQEIVQTPTYDWEWQWGPANNDIFDIPAAGTPSSSHQLTIAARNVEGTVSVVAQAVITADDDRNPQTRHPVGKIFSGSTELTAMFCEQPWPAANLYPYEDTNYNFTFGYCSDAGVGGNTTDDLPFLQELVLSDNQGNSEYGDITNDGEIGFDDIACYNEAAGAVQQPECVKASLRVADLDCNGAIDQVDRDAMNLYASEQRLGDVVDNNDDGIPDCKPEARGSFDEFNAIADENSLRQTVFFNEQNDDVIGVQIFANPDASLRTARAWVVHHFPFNSNLRDISVGGYDGVTDGNTIYISALNEVDRNVYTNIYVFSINPDAQPSTREVFTQLLDSLEFNTNITDFGYCLNSEQPGNRLPLDEVGQNNIAAAENAVQCNTDFDCKDGAGNNLPGTNGVCSNARTKFLRDWERLGVIQDVQGQIENIKQEEGSYPTFGGGTFIPQYTNSMWPSWGRLGSNIPRDPVNEWTSCGRCSDGGNACGSDADCEGEGNVCELVDPQTCWDAAATQFICPAASQMLEYEARSANQYVLHAPLEYFRKDDEIVNQFVDQDQYSAEPWCQPLVPKSPLEGQCGDGVVNGNEECDPPGSITRSDTGADGLCPDGSTASRTCTNECKFEYGQCSSDSVCGNGIVDAGETCDDGVLNGTYGHCADEDSYPQSGELNGEPLFECYQDGGNRYCGSQAACKAPHIDYCGNGELDEQHELCDASAVPGAVWGYSDVEADTCSFDCQSLGGYCGDGIVQEAEEACDDGNNINDDACSNACELNEVEQVDPALSGICGDGIVQNPNEDGVPEVCDLGDQNGVACDPAYNSSCVYCSADCRREENVEAVAQCGNGLVDITHREPPEEGQEEGLLVWESCDIDPETNNVLVADNNSRRLIEREDGNPETGYFEGSIRQCQPPLEEPNKYVVGEYSCENQCSTLVSGCVTCGLRDVPGPIPQIALLNVLENNDQGSAWSNRIQKWLATSQIDSLQFNTKLAEQSLGNYQSYQPLLNENQIDNGQRLEANTLCSEAYVMTFNPDIIGERKNLDDSFNNEDEIRESVQSMVDEGYLGLFPYKVNGEQRAIQNELSVSPAVPEGSVRVVVRWDGSEDSTGAFVGNIYSSNLVDPFVVNNRGRLSFVDVLGRVDNEYGSWLCSRTSLDRDSGLWRPNGCRIFDGAYMNSIVFTEGNSLRAQATTIDISKLSVSPTSSVDFYVSTLTNNNESILSAHARYNNSVCVDIYLHQNNQDATYSLYPPDKTICMDEARDFGNNNLAKYWHVFTIVDERHVRNEGLEETVHENIRGQQLRIPMELRTPYLITQPVSNVTQETSPGGFIETDFVDVLCNVPGEGCNRDQ